MTHDESPQPPSPPHKRTFTDSARRAQIVDEAVRTIAEIGYARASLGEIANRLGVSKGIISYHFSSKDELIQEIINDTIERGSSFVRGYVNATAPAAQQLRNYIRSELAFIGAHQPHALALVEIYNARVADYAPYARAFASALEEMLERGQREGAFRPFSAKVMARTIRSAIEAVPQILASDPALDVDEYARQLADLFDAATVARDAERDEHM